MCWWMKNRAPTCHSKSHAQIWTRILKKKCKQRTQPAAVKVDIKKKKFRAWSAQVERENMAWPWTTIPICHIHWLSIHRMNEICLQTRSASSSVIVFWNKCKEKVSRRHYSKNYIASRSAVFTSCVTSGGVVLVCGYCWRIHAHKLTFSWTRKYIKFFWGIFPDVFEWMAFRILIYCLQILVAFHLVPIRGE